MTLFWFRRDLRLEDNHGLLRALELGEPVQPIFIFDQNILNRLSSPKDARVSFIHGRLLLLQKQLQDSITNLVQALNRERWELPRAEEAALYSMDHKTY